MGRRRRRRRRGWRWRSRRRTKLHRQAGDDILRIVAGFVPGGVRREAERWERQYAFVVECRVGAGQVPIIDVKGEQRIDVVPDTGNRLIAETPGISLQEGPAKDRIGEWRPCT